MKRNVILSFCIATRNRAALIGMTLRSILDQLTDECEVVVVDGASTDETQSVVRDFSGSNDSIRYFRQQSNGGVDQDFDTAVCMANGVYCWLMPDDDVLTSGAVESVLLLLRNNYGVVLVNVEHRDSASWRVLSSSMTKLCRDCWFGPDELSRLFEETVDLVTYIGCVVVKRSLWMSRDRSQYYGSEFIHVGTIFQSPVEDGVYVVARPLVSVRLGTQQWYTRAFNVWLIKWPTLVASLPLSEGAKQKVIRENTLWEAFFLLLNLRSFCAYSIVEYRQYTRLKRLTISHRLIARVVAVTPMSFANTCCIFLTLLKDRRERELGLSFLRRSPACNRWWRLN